MRARRKSRSKLGVYSISIPVPEDSHDHVLGNAFFCQALLDGPDEGGILGLFPGAHVFVHDEVHLNLNLFQVEGLAWFEDFAPEARLDPHDQPPRVGLLIAHRGHAQPRQGRYPERDGRGSYRVATGTCEGASRASGAGNAGWKRRASGCTGFFVNMKMNAPKEAMSASAAKPSV